MRGQKSRQSTFYSYLNVEDRIPADHPIRKLRIMVDGVLGSMSEDFSKLYSKIGRPSIPPEQLLRAMLLQVLYSVRSERQLVEQMNYNLLFRWFVGLGMDDKVWNHSTFSVNRDRLLNETVLRRFFEAVRMVAEWQELTSDEHFSVDGTIIEAWASMKSLVPRQETPPEGGSKGGGRNPDVDFKGEKRTNATHVSTTDPDARLFRKGPGKGAQLCYLGHALIENRNGLVVDVEVTQASGTAEWEAALTMVKRTRGKSRATLAGDKGYDSPPVVEALRRMRVTPHVAKKKSGGGIDGRTTRHAGYAISQRRRKLVEQVFGWAKTIGGLEKTRFKGTSRVASQTLITASAYNLIRLVRLIPWRSYAI